MMHYYAFGSLCRGEFDSGSDIDLLACVDDGGPLMDPEKFSIYKYSRIKDLWLEGNPFSWHLYLESKILYSSDQSDFLKDLGQPSPYIATNTDCKKFKHLFDISYESVRTSTNSKIFNLSCMFLAVRNFATCYSLGLGRPVFSRRSPLLIADKLDIDEHVFDTLVRARLLSTRGHGKMIEDNDIHDVLNQAPSISEWMNILIKKAML